MDLQFNHARSTTLELQPFATATSVLEFLVNEPERLEEKNAIYAALVQAVQMRTSWARLAMNLLWCGLWPGLDAVYRRQLGYFRREPDELTSLVSLAFTTLVDDLDLQAVQRIAATLIRSTERDVGRARQRQLAVATRTVLLPTWAPEGPADELPDGAPVAAATGDTPAASHGFLGIAPGLSIGAQAAAVHRWLRAVVGDDAEIYFAIAVCDENPREVAERLGLSHVALRNAYSANSHAARKIAVTTQTRHGHFRSRGRARDPRAPRRRLMEMQQTQSLPPGVPMPKPDDFARVPGLYQRFELQQVVKPGPDFYIELGGKLTDGTQVFAVYTRPSRGRRIL